MPRIPQLDGWRAISILCVLAAHLLPLGPKPYRLNETSGVMGMSLFFILSGFLIASTLLYRPSVREFLVRRLCRVLPLAWLFLLIVLPLLHAPKDAYPAHFFFYLNLPPWPMTLLTGHFWSLCVEMHFYMTVALLFAVLRRRSLLLFPVLAIAVTIARIWHHETASIVTWYRIDELFAGVTLALIHHGLLGRRIAPILGRANPYCVLALLVLSSQPDLVVMNYFRPYLAAMMIGSTILNAEKSRWNWLTSRPLAYIAAVSYALYVIHPVVMHGWFDPADKVLKYARRPIGFALCFGLAHVSTFYYESRWIAFGKRVLRRAGPVPAEGGRAADSTAG